MTDRWGEARLIGKVNRHGPWLLFTLIPLYLISTASPKLQRASLFTFRFQVPLVVGALIQVLRFKCCQICHSNSHLVSRFQNNDHSSRVKFVYSRSFQKLQTTQNQLLATGSFWWAASVVYFQLISLKNLWNCVWKIENVHPVSFFECFCWWPMVSLGPCSGDLKTCCWELLEKKPASFIFASRPELL